RHITTLRVNRPFHPSNDTRIPAEAGAYQFTGQVLHYYSHASVSPTKLWPPRPIALSFSLINTLLEESVVSLYQKLTKMPLTCKQLRERPATCGAASTKPVTRLTTALRADPQFDLGRSCPQRTD